jgi:hypothetical protein
LQEKYKTRHKDANKIGSEVCSWAGVIQYLSEFTALSRIVAPYLQLLVYVDSLLC